MKGSGSAKSERGQAAPFRYEEGVLTLTLHVQPGAKRSELAGLHGSRALRLRLAAPARDGKANKAAMLFLAKALKVPTREVTIVKGLGSRDKVVKISSVPKENAMALLDNWMS